MPVRRGDDEGVRKVLFAAGVTAVAVAALAAGRRWLGADSAGFAFVVVWVPMTWLGTLSRVVRPRLPEEFHRLLPFERSGRLYEHLGVRVFKALLRRGPLAWFNPDLHLPTERSPEQLTRLEQRMRDAEAAHALLFVATLGVVAHALANRWLTAAALTLAFDVVLNGYPVVLQRYNRALLHGRYGPQLDGP